jgi:pilus assembly protein FimV
MPLELHWRKTRPFPNRDALSRLFSTASVAALILCGAPAHAVGLGELELRSYLGEPLHLRVGVITQNSEEVDPSCFAVVNTSRGDAIVRRDVRIALIETRNARYLEIRGNSSFNEPIGTIAVRAACKGDSGVIREYPILLDPAPLLAPTAATGATTAREVPSRATAADPNPLSADTRAATAVTETTGATGRWTVYAGDTLNSLARGIYPASRARQNQYIAALRQLNPELSGIGNNTPLYPNSQLVLPDLKALSAMRPGAAPRMSADAAASASAEPAPPSARTRPRATAERRPRATPPMAREVKPVETVADAKAATRQTVADTKAPVATTAGDGFRLRVSGSEMDLSRTKGVTDEERAYLRERRSLLDADDQTAQILALKNTVSQIEKRLNEMQLKLATLPTPGGATGAGTATGTAAGTGIVPIDGPAASPPATPPATETTAIKPAPKPAPAPAPLPRQGWIEQSLLGLPLSWIIGGLSIVALTCLAWWLSRRRKAETKTPLVSGKPAARNETNDAFNSWANEGPAAKPAATNSVVGEDGMTDAERSASLLMGARREKPAPAQSPSARPLADAKPATTSTATRAAAGIAGAAAGMGAAAASAKTMASTVAAPRKPAQPSLAQRAQTDTFELDEAAVPTSESATTEADRTVEDRMRRLRYMQERYPELGARTVSIDDPDSVINAARLYNEEKQLGKACELLIYAVEERPQEIRYWLAQFELFRIEKMVPQFGDLAAKFEVLFGHTDSWPKVQQLGYTLDPLNPLYAAAARVNEEDKFNPMTENWLNAPIGDVSNAISISHALVADLRSALFREHSAKEEDLINVTSRIAARAAA